MSQPYKLKKALGPHYRKHVADDQSVPFYVTDTSFSKRSVGFRVGEYTSANDRSVCFSPEHIRLQDRSAELSFDNAYKATSQDPAFLELLGKTRLLIAWIPVWLVRDRHIDQAKQLPGARK